MTRDLEVMKTIIAEKEKEKEINKAELQELDAEGKEMAEHKRFTIDMVAAPVDPLR